jgi:Holliday junction resolvase RusA-like endonuclease
VGLGWWRNGDPYPHTATPDLDNLVKAVLDAATKADIWQDDRVVASVVAAKWVCGTDSSPRTEFRVGYIGGAHE